MTSIAHISDLHFGRVNPAAVAALGEAIARLRPTLVAVSGDLTQRARSHQFQQARAFLDSLPVPTLVVPGNHDVPLHNIFARWRTPLDKYRRHVEDNLAPTFADGRIAVQGLNTARSLTVKDGRLNARQVEQACAFFTAHRAAALRILVTHHPFDVADGAQEGDIVGRARLAVERLAACGADLILSGHLHGAHISHSAERYGPASRILLIQAGTATSTRLRDEQNTWNLIRTDGDGVTVEVMASSGGQPFTAVRSHAYRRTAQGWETVARL